MSPRRPSVRWPRARCRHSESHRTTRPADDEWRLTLPVDSPSRGTSHALRGERRSPRAARAARRGRGHRPLSAPRHRLSRDVLRLRARVVAATATSWRPRPRRAAPRRCSSSARSSTSGSRRCARDRVREALGPLAHVIAGRPSEHMAVVGVTGTNGKTTTAFLVAAMFEAAGLPSGLLGTVEARVGGVRERARADDARGTRPAPAARAHARRRRRGVRARGIVDRDLDGSSRGTAARRGRVHEPLAGPPRLPRLDGRVPRRQGVVVRRPLPACGERRRSGRKHAARRAALRGRDARRRVGEARRARPDRNAARGRHATRDAVDREPLARPVQRRERAVRDLAGPARRPAGRGDRRRRGRRGRAAGPLRAGRRRSGVRRDRRLRAHAHGDRGGAAQRAGARPAVVCCASSVRAATAIAPSAR